MSEASLAYWQEGRGLGNITPQNKPLPEGPDFVAALAKLFDGKRNAQQVIEVGCGIGRLARYFSAARYLGLDISADAIERARHDMPNHHFELMMPFQPIGGARAELSMLCHTVALHLDDCDLHPFIASLKAPRVVLSEIMGRQWRRPGDPPVFNRDSLEYVQAFREHGFWVESLQTMPYAHYGDRAKLTMIEFQRRLDP